MSASSQLILGPVPHFKNEWASGTNYKKGAIVYHNGSSYTALIANPSTEPSFTYDPATGTFTVSEGWGLLAVGAAAASETLLGEFKAALGYSAEKSIITLTAGETGKYVKCATRSAAVNANFNISEPFDVEACTELLIKTGYNPSDNTHAALDISVIALYEETERIRTVQKKNSQNQPLYYVVIIDPETGSETVTTEETTVDTGHPVYIQETYTEHRYLPNNEDRFVKIPDTGYYVANIPQSCKCVVSYKPGVTDLEIVAIKYGCLANLTSQLYGIYEHRTMAEAVASLAERLQALEDNIGKLGKVTAESVDALELTKYLYPTVLFGAGVPAAATKPANLPEGLPWDGIPAFKGQLYINTEAASGGLYYAKGVGAVSDWINA